MNPTPPNRYASIFAAFQALIPGFTVRTKEDSLLMHLLAGLLFFNPRFLSDYTTTLGRTVFFPSPAWVRSKVDTIDEVLSHEGVHAFDYHRSPFRFVLAYVLPQALALFPLLAGLIAVLASSHRLWMLAPAAFVVLAVALAGIDAPGRPLVIAIGALIYASILGTLALAIWASVPVGITALVLLLVFVCPWPSKGRTAAELRGYGMTLAFHYWKGDDFPQNLLEWVKGQFVGPAYYWMSWSGEAIMRELADIRDKTRSGILIGAADDYAPYRLVHAEVTRLEGTTAAHG
jgi:hypothetical protein